MVQPARILVVDDDARVVEEYVRILTEDGYAVEAVSSIAAARRALESRREAVVLDQKLEGPAGPDAGLDLIADASLAGAKVIIVTGFATPEAIVRAYDAGAYDYLQKGSFHVTQALLRAKVKRAVSQVLAERAASRTPEEREQYILEQWGVVCSETDSSKKGRALEELLAALLRTVPGFEVHPDLRTGDEQLDLVVMNHAPGWEKESNVILVEAKNWSSKVDPNEYDVFFRKVERRSGRCTLGLLVAANGFTNGVSTRQQADRTSPVLILLLGREDLEELVRSPDRGAVLRSLLVKQMAGE